MGAGLYIHIPFCRRKCLYCDFPSWAGREDAMEDYADALVREMDLAARERERLPVETVYVGGGTPSLLPPRLTARILEAAGRRFELSGDAEITMEANPGTVDRAGMKRYRAMGFNRLSLGLQAAQDELLRRLGRVHDFPQFLSAVEAARAAGFENIGADLMSGLPGQRTGDLSESVRAVAAAGCAHVSLYALSVEPGTPFYAMRDAGSLELPGEEDECGMAREAREALARYGYVRYEISSYAREGRACRHNLNYWDNGDYIGLGCGAASHREGVRFKNTADLDRYLAAMGRLEPEYGEWEKPSDEEAAFETVMLALRTTAGLDLARFRRRHGLDFRTRYGGRADDLVRGGLAVAGENRFALTERGMDVQNQALLYLTAPPR